MNVQIIGNGNITSNNFNACFIVNNNVLVDTPPGTLKELKKLNKDLDDINIILITHLHGDHFFDLPFIILHEYKRRRSKELFIIGPKNLKKELGKLIKLAFKSILYKYLAELKITFIDAESIQNHEINEGLYLTSIQVTHGDLKNCYGYLFQKDEKVLGITGDIKMCPGLTYMLKKVNYVVIDVAEDGRDNHLNLSELKALSKEYNVNYVPIHFPDEIAEELAKIKNVKIINPEEQFYV